MAAIENHCLLRTESRDAYVTSHGIPQHCWFGKTNTEHKMAGLHALSINDSGRLQHIQTWHRLCPYKHNITSSLFKKVFSIPENMTRTE
jgi:hypothetical protein